MFVSEFQLTDAEYPIEKLAHRYFKQNDSIHTKHLSQRGYKYLHLALAGGNIHARYVENWIPELPITNDLPLDYYSDKHRKTL